MQLVVFLAECFEVSLGHGTVCNKVYEVDLLVLSKKHFFGAVRYYRDPHVRSVKNNFFSLHCSICIFFCFYGSIFSLSRNSTVQQVIFLESYFTII